LIVADIWAEKRIITIDQLGNEFLNTVVEGDTVSVRVDGTVIIN
jgi:hypothetical protein